MKHFTEFVHFINSEKKLEFKNTKSFQNSLSVEQYNKLEYDKDRLLMYKDHTHEEFKNYINTIKDVIKNEIQDEFDKRNKENLQEIHNKSKLLIKQLESYKTLKIESKQYRIFEGINFIYPDTEIEKYTQLTQKEKSEISNFLKLEFDLIYEIKENIRNLEDEYKYKQIVEKNTELKGFTFNTEKNIDLQTIYCLIKDKLIDCDEETFTKVFNGGEIKSSPKIKWLIKNRNGSIGKRALFYFLDQPIFSELSENDIVEKTDFFFVNDEGKKLIGRTRENFRQYKQDLEKIESPDFKEKWKNEVDDMTSILKNYLQS